MLCCLHLKTHRWLVLWAQHHYQSSLGSITSGSVSFVGLQLGGNMLSWQHVATASLVHWRWLLWLLLVRWLCHCSIQRLCFALLLFWVFPLFSKGLNLRFRLRRIVVTSPCHWRTIIIVGRQVLTFCFQIVEFVLLWQWVLTCKEAIIKWMFVKSQWFLPATTTSIEMLSAHMQLGS